MQTQAGKKELDGLVLQLCLLFPHGLFKRLVKTDSRVFHDGIMTVTRLDRVSAAVLWGLNSGTK